MPRYAGPILLDVTYNLWKVIQVSAVANMNKSRVWGKVPDGSALIFGDMQIFL